jgi:hypothetical protein
MDFDIWEVVDAAGKTPYGFMQFTPGPGMGGHRLPVNQQMPCHCGTGSLAPTTTSPGRSTARVSDKGGVGDTRESPSPRTMEVLIERGAELSHRDAYAPSLPELWLENVRLGPRGASSSTHAGSAAACRPRTWSGSRESPTPAVCRAAGRGSSSTRARAPPASYRDSSGAPRRRAGGELRLREAAPVADLVERRDQIEDRRLGAGGNLDRSHDVRVGRGEAGETVIGRGSRIGGNVWLTRSVPPYSVVTPTARVDRHRGEASPYDDLVEFNI